VTEALERARNSEESRITDEKIEAVRQRIGIVSRRELRPSFEFAALDSMRNYARGIGDINPFYRDPAYAADGPWGQLTAHPTFLLYMGVRDPEPEDSSAAPVLSGGDPLAGVHSFYSGEDMRWYRPIVAGDRFTVRSGVADVEEHTSRMGGRSVHEFRETAFRDADSRLVGIRRKLRVRIDRSAARSKGKNSNLDVPHHYTPDELAAIEADYDREYVRGAEPRYWEDVRIGEQSVPLVRGPYTTTSYICYAEATGPRNDYHRSHSEAYQYRKKHPRAFPLNDLGYPDTVARVHWDRDMAARAGLPETYDFGGERIGWMSNVVTHWIGDHGFLHFLSVRLRAFNFVGDTVWLRATVTDKREVGALKFVDLELNAVNQRQDTIATGKASVVLPSTSSPGLLTAPVPVEEGATIF
jgi:acyl dehydratase